MRETPGENNIEEAQLLMTAFCFNTPQSVDIISLYSSLTGNNIKLWIKEARNHCNETV